MNRAFILLDSDVIQAGDFVRPLNLTFDGQSDYLQTENTYSGTPINHTRWLEIERAGMDRWIGNTVGEFNLALDGLAKPWQASTRYEFCRGTLKQDHVLSETDNEREKRMDDTKLPVGKYKDKTLKYVRSHDMKYYFWMCEHDLIEKWINS